jgi:hypothetical protein
MVGPLERGGHPVLEAEAAIGEASGFTGRHAPEIAAEAAREGAGQQEAARHHEGERAQRLAEDQGNGARDGTGE